jgi:hypothetical protein
MGWVLVHHTKGWVPSPSSRVRSVSSHDGWAGGQFAHHGNKRTTYFHSQPQSAGFDRDLPFLHIEKKEKKIQNFFI